MGVALGNGFPVGTGAVGHCSLSRPGSEGMIGQRLVGCRLVIAAKGEVLVGDGDVVAFMTIV